MKPVGNKRLVGFVTLLLALTSTFARAQHTHVQLSYTTAQQWRLFIYDFDSGEFDPAIVPIIASQHTFSFVPSNAFTNFLGPAGGGVWTLSETEIADILYLGIGTTGIAPGTFENNQMRLHLRSLSGPGHFALYNIDPFGMPIVHMNSRDGLDGARDFVAVSAVGGHIHVNWAFSTPGMYRLGFAASGRLATSRSLLTSHVVEFTFYVEDVTWRPRLTLRRLVTNPGLQLVVHGPTGRSCLVETALSGASWLPLTNWVFSESTRSFDLPAALPLTLYRANILPP